MIQSQKPFSIRPYLPQIQEIISLCAEYCIELVEEEMAEEQVQRAHWNEQEQLVMVQYLSSRMSEIGDNGAFKKKVWNDVAKEISPLLTKGPAKTAASCKSKFKSVCIHVYPRADNH